MKVENTKIALLTSSSETQGQLVGAGKRLNGRGKKSGEEKSRTKVGAPGILLLTDQFRNHLKSLPVIGQKNICCAQSESSSFHVTFVTSYSKVFTAKLFARVFAINYLLVQESFPRSKSAIETRTMKPKKKNFKFRMFVNQPEKASTEKIRLD